MNSKYYLLVTLIFLTCNTQPNPERQINIDGNSPNAHIIHGVNEQEIPIGSNTIAIVGARLIDGTGKPPLLNSVVIVKENTIWKVGESGEFAIPSNAEIIDGKGLTLLPGLIDAHFHLDGNSQFPNLFLRHGITSLRDPGAWIEAYSKVRESGKSVPRLFLTGPHFDMPPPAYPKNSIIVRDPDEARIAVNIFADQGASAIKVYFRLPLATIKEVCATAHQRGIPVTAHLEITNAMDAIEAGLDGIEHITSFGTALLPTIEAEAYKQSILADNNARRNGRYNVWNAIDINSKKVDTLTSFLSRKETFVCPTLGTFEYRFGNGKQDSIKVTAFENMMTFVGKANKSGVKIVVGSHSWVPYAEVGWAYQQEMILLAESGLSNMEIIVAATMENARFFRIEDRLGSVEAGKQADLLLIEGNPLEDLTAFYNVRKVLLNGVWVPDVED